MKLINIVEDIKTEESPNLPEENLKELKKGKTVLKALKKGKIDIEWIGEKYDISYDIMNVYFYWDTYSNKEVFHMEVTNMDVYVEDVKLYNSLVKKTDDSLWDLWNKDSFRNILSRHIGRRFKNFKISSHISDARLNYVLNKPKPMNEVSEELVNKKIQRGKAVYKLLKTGLIGSKAETDEPMFRYELSDDPSISYRDDLGLIIFVSRVKINQLNRAAVTASIGRIQSKINERFKRFNITLSYPRITSDDVETNIIEEMDNKMDKKVKAVYTAFKTGIVKGKVNQNDKYRYVLSDDYTYNIYKQTLSGRDVAVVTPSEGIKVYYLQQNGEEILLPQSSHPNTYRHVLDKISNKTGQYNIYIEVKL